MKTVHLVAYTLIMKKPEITLGGLHLMSLFEELREILNKYGYEKVSLTTHVDNDISVKAKPKK
jgi:hypothetical protein